MSDPALGRLQPHQAGAGVAARDPPPDNLDRFVESCERFETSEEVGELLFRAAGALGFKHVALWTHGDDADLGALAVLAHNCGPAFEAGLNAHRRTWRDRVVKRTEIGSEVLYWSSPRFRNASDGEGAAWIDAACALGISAGISQRIETNLAPASVTAAPTREELDFPAFRRVRRMAAYALSHIQMLQRGLRSEAVMLTEREHQCTMMAVQGLRPSQIAKRMGISIHTVRTHRKSVLERLQARSHEEAVWLMIESGQLFTDGRKARPRRQK